MFDSQQKSTGTEYTRTVALLAVAFIFCPALVVVLRPVGFAFLMLVIASSALCVTLAWVSWKKTSQLFIPSIVGPAFMEPAIVSRGVASK